MARAVKAWLVAAAGLGLLGCSDDGEHAAGMTDVVAWMAAAPAAGQTAPAPPVVPPTMDPIGVPEPVPPPPAAMPIPSVPEPAPGCGASDPDSDEDGSPDCQDACPEDPMKTTPGACGCGQAEPAPGETDCSQACAPDDLACASQGDGEPEPEPEPDPELCAVAPLPDALREAHNLDAVYTRYASARGVPILASDSPQEEALRRACMLVRDLSQQPQVLETMLERKIGLVVMGTDETSADFPEFARWGVPDSRARGLGGVPRGLCAEENIMCDRAADRWRGESICLHEFAHTMHLGVYNVMDRTFDDRVEAAYRAALAEGKYQNTYAGSQPVEYFAEAVQDWYNTNLESARPNGVHNEINTRSELLEYDPAIYEILAEVLPDEPSYTDCYHYE